MSNNSLLLHVPSVKKLLSPLFSVVNSTTVLPILEDVMILKNGNDLSFTASDLENTLILDVSPVHQEGDIRFCLKGQVLKQFLNNSLSETVSMTFLKNKDR